MPAAAVPLFLDALEQDATSVAAFEDGADGAVEGSAPPWRVELLHEAEPDHAGAGRPARAARGAGGDRADRSDRGPACRRPTGSRGRGRASRRSRSAASGSTAAMSPSRRRPAAWPIQLDAGLAFGSGEHATTQGCLLALDRLARRRRPRRVLDLGCGSGHPRDRGREAGRRRACWPPTTTRSRSRSRAPTRPATASAIASAAWSARATQPAAARVRPLRPDPRQHPGRPLVRAGARDRAVTWRLAASRCSRACSIARQRGSCRRIAATACACARKSRSASGPLWL